VKKNRIIALVSVVIFILIAIKIISYSAIFDNSDNEAENIKAWKHKIQTVEGSFFDANGEEIFAPTEPLLSDTTHLPVAFSYILGYNNHVYGASGLRSYYSSHLYKDMGTKKGGSIQLTIDKKLQELAYDMLKDNNLSGSVIVLNAKNSEIMVMAGRQKIDYDINLLNTVKYSETDSNGKPEYQKTWEKYLSTPEFFIDPSTMDKKAPGSIYKIVTSAAAVLNGLEEYTYEDTGVIEVDRKPIRNAAGGVYGLETLQTALAHSTNTYFASLSLELGRYAMNDIADRFLVGEDIDIDFTTLRSDVSFDSGNHNRAMIGFGQGALAITPLHIAMIGQSIVNDGVMYKPTIVKSTMGPLGNTETQNAKHEIIAQPLKPDVAKKVKELLIGVTEYEDSKRGEGNEWRKKYTENIYCKTGTAEAKDNTNIYNSYYLCMTDDYVILITVKDTTAYGSNFKPWAEEFLKILY